LPGPHDECRARTRGSEGLAGPRSRAAAKRRLGRDDPDAWIAFYRRLRDRKDGRYSEFYADTVQVLEAAKRDLARAGRG
jgi:hypothetical protein